MTVRETITVNSERIKINRGIFRDFPTTYDSPSGRRTVVGFDVQEVTRDGRREPFRTERRSNGVRVYIGDADVFIPKGRHVYEISYKTDRQLGFFDDFDELFWNVTGNGWEFPIDRARATIHLPGGANVLNRAGYTGAFGERGQDFIYTAQTDGTLSVETNRALRPREGLSIAVSWPRGFVQRPSDLQKLEHLLRDNGATVAGVAGLVLLFAYYLVIWMRVGRDPERGAIFPLYEPPKGLSPAGARYVTRMSFDDKTFTAAIVSLAVKGFLTIKEGVSSAYTLERTGQPARLSKGETAIVLKLFPGITKRIELEQENHEILESASAALQQSLRTEFEKIYFVRNTRYFAPGIAISIIALILMVAASDQFEITGIVTVWLAIWTAVIYYLARRVWRGWRALLSGSSAVSRNDVIVATIFSVPFFGGELMGFTFYADTTSVGAAIIVVLIQLLNVVFYHLLKAPTRLGRRAMDAIAGFKDYLSVAEKDRMNFLNPPEKTPELFEQFLPYALALGVEQQWAEQFSDVLANAAREDSTTGGRYRPRWYSGRSFDSGFSDCASTLSGGFTSAISSASTAPGSSSGLSSGGFSSGGGSSGGGGGGGGGGGW